MTTKIQFILEIWGFGWDFYLVLSFTFLNFVLCASKYESAHKNEKSDAISEQKNLPAAFPHVLLPNLNLNCQ